MKTIFNIVAILLVIPFVAFAAWWNPFTWFKSEEINSNHNEVINEIVVTESPQIDKQIMQTEEIPEVDNIEINSLPQNTAESDNNDYAEIDALRREVQELRSYIQSTQSSHIKSNPIIVNEASSSNAEIIDRIDNLEKRISTLETRIRDVDYNELISRIDTLEKKPTTQLSDNKYVIEELVKRVNSLVNGGVRSGTNNDQYILCDSVMIQKVEAFYISSGVPCKDLYRPLSY